MKSRGTSRRQSRGCGVEEVRGKMNERKGCGDARVNRQSEVDKKGEREVFGMEVSINNISRGFC